MEMLRQESPAPGPRAPLALELGAAPAPLALELGAPAPSTGPVQPRAEALQQEVNKLREQLLQNEVSKLKDQLARAVRQRRYETPRPGREAVCPVEPVTAETPPGPARVPAEGEEQGVAPASELASAPESEGPVDPGAPAEVETPLAPELEPVQCVLCHENFNLTDAGLLKMPHCTHTWHADCVARYMEVTGKPLEAACPMRCTPTEDQVPDDVFELGDEVPVA